MPLKTLFGTFAIVYYFFLALLPEMSSNVYRRLLFLVRRFQRSRHVVVALLNTAKTAENSKSQSSMVLSKEPILVWNPPQWKLCWRIPYLVEHVSLHCMTSWPWLSEGLDTKMRKAPSVKKRIAVVLWRLATGDTYRSTSLQFGVGRTTGQKRPKKSSAIHWTKTQGSS